MLSACRGTVWRGLPQRDRAAGEDGSARGGSVRGKARAQSSGAPTQSRAPAPQHRVLLSHSPTRASFSPQVEDRTEDRDGRKRKPLNRIALVRTLVERWYLHTRRN